MKQLLVLLVVLWVAIADDDDDDDDSLRPLINPEIAEPDKPQIPLIGFGTAGGVERIHVR